DFDLLSQPRLFRSDCTRAGSLPNCKRVAGCRTHSMGRLHDWRGRIGPPDGDQKSMIRSELLQALSAENPDLRPDEVEQVVDIFFDEIGARLAEGGRVELRGFGTFSTRLRNARVGRNPRTGDPVDVPRSEEHTSELQSREK